MLKRHSFPAPLMIERTLVIVKPDGVKARIIGDVISRLERMGLKIIGLKMVRATEDQMAGFYPSDEEWFKSVGNKSIKSYQEMGIDIRRDMGTDDPAQVGKIVKQWLVKYMVETPIVLIVVEGNHAIDTVRKLVGHTLPYMAAPGTIRGDYSTDSPDLANKEKRAIHNLVHASDGPESAAREIHYWFSDNELYDW